MMDALTHAGMDALTEPLLAALDEVLAPANVILRNDTPVRALEGLGSEVRAANGWRIMKRTTEPMFGTNRKAKELLSRVYQAS